MSRKVINITHSATKYDILSQTPKNYNKDNYFLNELQHKVNAEWNYRPNRVDVEFEQGKGTWDWHPLEVVVQSVLSEKGSAISNDTRRLVFKNILEDRFNIGDRFRFSEDYDLSAEENAKNVWLVSNLNKVSMTSSVIVERCNGTLGSLWDNGDGTVSRHYEPVIQGKDLTSVNFFYNETLISPQSQLLIIAQHNEYTRQYTINQRFIIGYDKVYRIKAINKFYSNSTKNPEDVGLLRIYLEIVETSEKDDFKHRIAYNNKVYEVAPDPEEGAEYRVAFKEPKLVPEVLGSAPVTFIPLLKKGNEAIPDTSFALDLSIEGVDNPSEYVALAQEGDQYIITKVKNYRKAKLQLVWSTTTPDNQTAEIRCLIALSR